MSKIVTIDEISLTNNTPKCIVLKQVLPKDNFIYSPKYFYFFTEANLYFYYLNYVPGVQLGYYEFEQNAVDSNSYLYLHSKVIPRKNIDLKNKYIKNSLDSIYLYFKFSTLENFPFNTCTPYQVLHAEKNISYKRYIEIDSFSISILLNNPDSCEFIIAFKRDSSIKYVDIFNYSDGYSIDTIHNFYEITGDICSICRGITFPSAYQLSKTDTFQISKINTNTYEFTQIESSDSVTIKKTIYTWQDINSLDSKRKQYLYMLPTFIKILECSGTYPRK